jgi:hypothetical protein
MEISRTCDECFTPVRNAFAANFKNGLEVGASVAVTVGGQQLSTSGEANRSTEARTGRKTRS